MNVYLLRDVDGSSMFKTDIDAVIISKTSTKEDIQHCIDQMKEYHNYDWQWYDLVDCLPEDCQLYSHFGRDDEVKDIWY